MEIDNAKELLIVLKELYEVLEHEDTSEITYVMRELPHIMMMLNNAISLKDDSIDNTIVEVRQRCKSFFTPHGGLSDYFIWRDDFSEREKVNDVYESYKKRMWILLEL